MYSDEDVLRTTGISDSLSIIIFQARRQGACAGYTRSPPRSQKGPTNGIFKDLKMIQSYLVMLVHGSGMADTG